MVVVIINSPDVDKSNICTSPKMPKSLEDVLIAKGIITKEDLK